MKISGVATMHAPAGQVWAALNDPAVLVVAIPGCERLEPTGPDSYRFVLTAGVASIRGTYSGDISLSDQHEPSSFVLTASGAGSPGTASTSVQIRLAATVDGCTELTYDADAVVGGMIASVGQRMIAAVAQRLAGDFFTSVDDAITGNGSRPGQPGQPVVPAGGQPGESPSGAYPAPRPAPGPFGRGVLTGAAAALAGVAVGRLLGRRGR